jgi:hypothetical protein
VGLQLPSDDIEYIDFYSNRSALDADILVFAPDITGYRTYYDSPAYEGKPALDDAYSAKLPQACDHWSHEIKTAFDNGKTTFLYLSEFQEVYIASGHREYAGSGRTSRVVRHVVPYNNYASIPFEFGKILSKRGSQIKPASDLGDWREYWNEFSELSYYAVYIEKEGIKPLFVTRTGSKTVGFVVSGKGSIAFLPPLDFSGARFARFNAKSETLVWTDEALQIGHRLTQAIVNLDSVLRGKSNRTPEPEWAKASAYRLAVEMTLEKEAANIQKQMADLRISAESTNKQLVAEGTLRALLFEKGPRLEDAVIQALQIMGFTAAPKRDGTSEIDVEFEDENGRYIGEVEGKDSKPIDVTKFSQLMRNIEDDFASESVSDYARGVLFGNADRLTEIGKRGDFFTTKCLKAAEMHGIALVRTPDLFAVAKKLKDMANIDFAKKCRQAIRDGAGKIVTFPDIGKN